MFENADSAQVTSRRHEPRKSSVSSMCLPLCFIHASPTIRSVWQRSRKLREVFVLRVPRHSPHICPSERSSGIAPSRIFTQLQFACTFMRQCRLLCCSGDTAFFLSRLFPRLRVQHDKVRLRGASPLKPYSLLEQKSIDRKETISHLAWHLNNTRTSPICFLINLGSYLAHKKCIIKIRGWYSSSCKFSKISKWEKQFQRSNLFSMSGTFEFFESWYG